MRKTVAIRCGVEEGSGQVGSKRSRKCSASIQRQVRQFPAGARKDKSALRWVARWGDGWCPIFLPPPVLRDELSKLRGECASAGRDFARLDITIMKRELRGDRASV